MGFEIDNEIITDKYTLVKFTFDSNFTIIDFEKFLGILSKLLDISEKNNKPFGFYVDARNAKMAPLNSATKLSNWMKKEKPRIKEKKMLKATAVCFNDKYPFLVKLLKGVFKIYPTVSPNTLTSNITVAKEFTLKYLNDL